MQFLEDKGHIFTEIPGRMQTFFIPGDISLFASEGYIPIGRTGDHYSQYLKPEVEMAFSA
jgi:hypothetical protein